MNILKAVNLRKIYGQGETEVKALDGVNLEVEKGEFVAIVGTSGSGKSTMLHMIGGLDNPTSGQVIVDGQNLSHMTDEKLTIFRRRNIGFVFQQYNLVPMLNVWENIVPIITIFQMACTIPLFQTEPLSIAIIENISPAIVPATRTCKQLPMEKSIPRI